MVDLIMLSDLSKPREIRVQKTRDKNFTSLITQQHREELGEINENWFEDLTEKRLEEESHKDVHPTDMGHTNPTIHLCDKTVRRHSRSSVDDRQIFGSLPKVATTALYSPEYLSDAIIDWDRNHEHDIKQTSKSAISSPARDGSIGQSPSQLQSVPTAATPPISFSSSLPEPGSTLKKLFATPSDVTTPSIKRTSSILIDPNISNQSWSSSLATTPRWKSNKSLSRSMSTSLEAVPSPINKHIGASRVLFSPAMRDQSTSGFEASFDDTIGDIIPINTTQEDGDQVNVDEDKVIEPVAEICTTLMTTAIPSSEPFIPKLEAGGDFSRISSNRLKGSTNSPVHRTASENRVSVDNGFLQEAADNVGAGGDNRRITSGELLTSNQSLPLEKSHDLTVLSQAVSSEGCNPKVIDKLFSSPTSASVDEVLSILFSPTNEHSIKRKAPKTRKRKQVDSQSSDDLSFRAAAPAKTSKVSEFFGEKRMRISSQSSKRNEITPIRQTSIDGNHGNIASTSDELCFTQISPSSLSAMCDVADRTENSQTRKLTSHAQSEPRQTEPYSTPVAPETKKKSVAVSLECCTPDVGLARDVKQSALFSTSDITTSTPLSEQNRLSALTKINFETPVKWKQLLRSNTRKISGASISKTNKPKVLDVVAISPIKDIHHVDLSPVSHHSESTYQDTVNCSKKDNHIALERNVLSNDKVVPDAAASEVTSDAGGMRPNITSKLLNRKSKRFSYPSSSEILDSRPRRVFSRTELVSKVELASNTRNESCATRTPPKTSTRVEQSDLVNETFPQLSIKDKKTTVEKPNEAGGLGNHGAIDRLTSDLKKSSQKKANIVFNTPSVIEKRLDERTAGVIRAGRDSHVEENDNLDETAKPIKILGNHVAYDGQDHLDNVSMAGFHMASGKKIDLDPCAIDKYANWLDQDETDNRSRDVIAAITNRREINTNMSKDAINGLPWISETTKKSSKTAPVDGASMTVPGSVSGFQTAGGKPIALETATVEKYAKWIDEGLAEESETSSDRDCFVQPDDTKVTDEARSGDFTHSIKRGIRYEEKGDETLGRNISMSNLPVSPTLESKQVCGFRSASGKNISVTEAAMEKFSKWVNDDVNDSPGVSNKSPNNFQNVVDESKRTSLKTYLISGATGGVENATADNFDERDGKIYRDKISDSVMCVDLPDDKESLDLQEDIRVNPNTSTPQLLGFQSASGRTIHVSDDNVKKFSKWLNEEQDGENNMLKNSQVSNAKTVFTAINSNESVQSFPVAGGAASGGDTSSITSDNKIVHNLHHKPAKTEVLLQKSGIKPPSKLERDWSRVPKGFRPFKPPRPFGSNKKPSSSGYPPASHSESSVSPLAVSHKEPEISPQTINSAKNLDPESEYAHVNKLPDNDLCDDDVPDLTHTQVTEVADGMMAFLKHEEENSQFAFTQFTQHSHNAEDMTPEEPAKLSNAGFATASGKQIDISDLALASASKFIQEAFNDDEANFPKVSSVQSNSINKTCVGERSGSGSVLKQKTELVDFQKENGERRDHPPFDGFEISGSHTTSVFGKSLDAADKLNASSLQDLQGGKQNSSLHTKLAENMKESIHSDESSAHEIVEHKSLHVVAPSVSSVPLTPELSGFQTASGMKVCVSHQALMKAKCFIEEEGKSEFLALSEVGAGDRHQNNSVANISNRENLQYPSTLMSDRGFPLEKELSKNSLKSASSMNVCDGLDIESGFKSRKALGQKRFKQDLEIAKDESDSFFNNDDKLTVEKLSSDQKTNDCLKHVPEAHPGEVYFSQSMDDAELLLVPMATTDEFVTDTSKTVDDLEREGQQFISNDNRVTSEESKPTENDRLTFRCRTTSVKNCRSPVPMDKRIPTETDLCRNVEAEAVIDCKTHFTINSGINNNVSERSDMETGAVRVETTKGTKSGFELKQKTLYPPKSFFGGIPSAKGSRNTPEASQQTTAELGSADVIDSVKSTTMVSDDVDHGKRIVNDVNMVPAETVSDRKNVKREKYDCCRDDLFRFQTANGKEVQISTESLGEARKMFSEIDSDLTDVMGTAKAKQASCHSDNKVNERNVNISTGSTVTVSRVYLEQTKNMLEQQNVMTESVVTVCPSSNDQSDLSLDFTKGTGTQGPDKKDEAVINTFDGFHTASGNLVKVSDIALKKARNLLDCEPVAGELVELRRPSVQLKTNEKATFGKFDGFQTANGTKVTISTMALENARHILEKDPIEDSDLLNNVLDKTEVDGRKLDDFKTPKGNKVKVSTKVLEKSRDFLIDETFAESCDVSRDRCPEQKTEILRKDDSSTKFSGFQTARGRLVNISAIALSKAKSLFESESVTEECAVSPISNEPNGDVRNRDTVIRQFEGFRTAKGNTVAISASALEKARSILQSEPIADEVEASRGVLSNVQRSESDGDGDTAGGEVGGFQTAIVARQSVSATALENTKTIIEADPVSEHRSSYSEEIMVMGENIDVSRKDFGGFHTAKGTKVTISASALAKARNMLGNDSMSGHPDVPSDPACHLQRDCTDVNPPGSVGTFSGFQTAKGSKVTMSATALAKARNLLESEPIAGQISSDSSREIASDNTGVKQVESLGTFGGFKTAKGNKVSVSATALAKARNLLESEPIVGPLSRDTCSEIPCGANQVESPSTFGGFQTAKGNKVPISATALSKARNLLDNDSDVLSVSAHKLEKMDSDTNQTTTERTFGGFQTAKGNKVTVSPSALERAKQVLESKPMTECNAKCQGREKIENVAIEKFSGFQTAKGNKVTVSSSALEKVRNILQDPKAEDFPILQTSTDNLKNRKTDKIEALEKFCGFQTAKGNKVIVSATALRKARNVLEDEPIAEEFPVVEVSTDNVRNEEIRVNEANDPKTFGGFQTAKGSKVTVSASALEQARHMLESEPVREGESRDLSGGVQSHFDGSVLEGKRDASLNVNSHVTKKRYAVSADVVTSRNSPEAGMDVKNTVSNAVTQKKQHLLDMDESVEASESAMALLADGDFEDSTAEEYKTDCRSTDRRINRKLFHGSARTSQRLPTTTMTAFSTTPEGMWNDRGRNSRTVDLAPLVTAPRQDVAKSYPSSKDSFHWPGPRSYSDRRRPQPTEHKKPKQFQPDNCRSQKTDKPSQGSRQKAEKSSTFSTPYKQQTSTFSTPYKTQAQTSKFVTPVKAMKTDKDKSELQASTNSATVKSDSPLQHKPPELPVSDLQIGLIHGEQSSSFPGNSLIVTKTRCSQTEVSGYIADPDTSAVSGGTGLSSPSVGSETIAISGITAVCANKEQSRLTASTSGVICNGSISDTQNADRPRVSVSDAVLKQRLKTRIAQGQRIKTKRLQGKEKAMMGSLLAQKLGRRPRLQLMHAVHYQRPISYTKNQLYGSGVQKRTLSVSVATAESFRFRAEDILGSDAVAMADGIQVGDGAFLIWDELNTVGKEEFCNGFLDMRGVEPNLISRDWVYNHYRWIVWKLAAMEVAFPQSYGGRCLTADHVMLQLKYRYDREVDRSERSAIKKFCERDDTPQKTMVLCVSGVSYLHPIGGAEEAQSAAPTTANSKSERPCQDNKSTSRSNAILEVTDGWYPIKALLDVPLTRLVQYGKIRVGDKLCMSGAELTGPVEAAPPLQLPGDTMLKLCANSTRRARWYAKLGYQKNPQPYPLPLCSLYPGGGTAGCVDVIISRTYPLQYLEKSPGGGSKVRGPRTEEKAAQAYQKCRQRKMEDLYSKLQADFERNSASTEHSHGNIRANTRWSTKMIEQLQNGQEIFEAWKKSADPANFESMLSEQQLSMLSDSRRHEQEDRQRELQMEFQQKLAELDEQDPVRHVTPLLKVRITGCHTKDMDSHTSTNLTIWRPTDDVIGLLTEGKRFKIYNLAVQEYRGHQKTCAVSLSATRGTSYQEVNLDENFLDLVYEPREVMSITELQQGDLAPHTDFDTVGMVFHISEPTTFDKLGGGESILQTIYLGSADEEILAVKFWGGMKAYCVEDLLHLQAFVACSNLQWKPDARSHVTCAVGTEISVFTLRPRQPHLKTEVDKLRHFIQDPAIFMKRMQTKLHSMFTGSYSANRSPHGGKTRSETKSDKRMENYATSPQVISASTPRAVPVINDSFLARQHTYAGATVSVSSSTAMQQGTACLDVRSPGSVRTVKSSGSECSAKYELVERSVATPTSCTYSARPDLETRYINTSVTTPRPPSRDTLTHRGSTTSLVYVSRDGTSVSGKKLTTPSSNSVGLESASNNADSVLNRKRALQKSKVQRLKSFGTAPPLQALHSPVPSALWKAFKPPSGRKTLQDSLQKNTATATSCPSPENKYREPNLHASPTLKTSDSNSGVAGSSFDKSERNIDVEMILGGKAGRMRSVNSTSLQKLACSKTQPDYSHCSERFQETNGHENKPDLGDNRGREPGKSESGNSVRKINLRCQTLRPSKPKANLQNEEVVGDVIKGERPGIADDSTYVHSGCNVRDTIDVEENQSNIMHRRDIDTEQIQSKKQYTGALRGGESLRTGPASEIKTSDLVQVSEERECSVNTFSEEKGSSVNTFSEERESSVNTLSEPDSEPLHSSSQLGNRKGKRNRTEELDAVTAPKRRRSSRLSRRKV